MTHVYYTYVPYIMSGQKDVRVYVYEENLKEVHKKNGKFC